MFAQNDVNTQNRYNTISFLIDKKPNGKLNFDIKWG